MHAQFCQFFSNKIYRLRVTALIFLKRSRAKKSLEGQRINGQVLYHLNLNEKKYPADVFRVFHSSSSPPHDFSSARKLHASLYDDCYVPDSLLFAIWLEQQTFIRRNLNSYTSLHKVHSSQ
jgi:hypothetical protein